MRIGLVQENPTVGDVEGNAALVWEDVKSARERGAELIVTSEMVISGYPARDLIFREGFVERCERAVMEIASKTRQECVLVGSPRRGESGTRPWRNSVAVCRGGKIERWYDKRLLPGYDVFDEDRYFYPGDEACVVEVGGTKVGVLVCEDVWRAADVLAQRRYRIDPVELTMREGCGLLVSMNASPFIRGKWMKHIELLRAVVKKWNVNVAAVNQVGGNDDLVFDGRSVVIGRDGRLIRVMKGFERDVEVVAVGDGVQLSSKHDSPPRTAGESWHPKNGNVDVDWREETWNALVLGVRDYWRKTGCGTAMIGLSGGIDSALCAVIASAALGAGNVTGVMMPSRYSSMGSVEDSKELARRLGLGACVEMPIREVHELMERLLRRELGERAVGVTDENVQSRLRGIMMMARSNATPGSLVLVTSNKSELAVGYSTLYGDMCGAVAPIGDVTKTRIYELAKWVNEMHAKLGFKEAPIPRNSIQKAPSAELRENQTDQDTLPAYAVLDEIVERYVEREESAELIIQESGIAREVVEKSVKMIDRAEYKRCQGPVVIKVSGRSFGRGREMPIVMKT
ncbi:MAG TPA: NAD+ synthase [Phycisphaerales bacterium]|nr:NAD+ synthase [Phycisphaerales bacterium]